MGLSQNIIEDISKLRKNGYTYSNISKILDINDNIIKKICKEHNIAKGSYESIYNDMSDEEKSKLHDLYTNEKISDVLCQYPMFTKNALYSIMSKNKIHNKQFFWTKEDEDFLINNIHKISYTKMAKIMNNRHTPKAISTKARKLNLTSPQDWNDNEIDLLKKYYSISTKDEMSKILPTRTYNAMVCMAMKLNIKSYQYLNEKYTNEEKQFIIDNFGILNDEEISKKLNKSLHGIQDQRRSLGLYYFNKNYSQYENITKFLRGHIQNWKQKSMENCNFKCVLTDSKNFDIHHIVGFSIIVNEVFKELDTVGKLNGDILENYSKEELDYMLEVFNKVHSKYPLGVCVNKDLHKLFHKIYGSGGNTQEQWDCFVKQYKNNDFKKIAI